MTLSAARRAAVLADKATLLVYKSLLSAYWANLSLDFGTIDNGVRVFYTRMYLLQAVYTQKA